jgi:hypothetical protein
MTANLLAVISGLAVFLIFIWLVLFACWLLATRLRKGEPAAKSFKEWLRNICEAVWGL